MENKAGGRTLMGLNEADPVEWTDKTRAHYRLEIGGAGDDRYLTGFLGREKLERTFRWSTGSAHLLLPVVAGKACTVTFECEIPEHAVAADSGVYLGQKLLAPLVSGKPLVAELPAAEGDRVQLELRCKGGVPKALIKGSNDDRTLGVLLRSVTVKTAGAGEAVFSANTGQWLPAATGAK